jgi:hypothetical protein
MPGAGDPAQKKKRCASLCMAEKGSKKTQQTRKRGRVGMNRSSIARDVLWAREKEER